MKRYAFAASVVFACAGLVAQAQAGILGTAESFGVLGAAAVTNTGPSTILGDLGVSPGTAITGFAPGSVQGTIHSNDTVAIQAQADALSAYNSLAALAPTQVLTGTNLGGLTLTPGVYFFESSAQLTGILTLDTQGLTDPLFVFQIGSTLTTASSASIITINGGDICNVFWQVGSSATLGTNSSFIGTILADKSITLTTGANVDGRAIALNEAVTMDTNKVSVPPCVPEPSTVISAGVAGLLALLSTRYRHRKNTVAA